MLQQDVVARHLRTGGTPATAPQQPWFENQMRGAALCSPNCTAGLAAQRSAAFQQGLLNNLFGLIDANRPGGPILNQQVFDLWFRTGGGRANYNAGFLSLSRRFASGLAISANYTLSKALDFQSSNQESESLISTGYDYNVDYAPAAFDRTHVFNSNLFYELPFGTGRHWLGTGKLLPKLAGGWYLSGIYTASTAAPLTVSQSTSAWGGSAQINAQPSGAIPTVARSSFSNSVYSGVSGSNGIGITGNPATRGTGLNLFANPELAFNSFRPIEISSDGRHGRGVLRGLNRWNVDLSIGKKTAISDRIQSVFSFDMINALNRVEFVDPTLSLQNRTNFGVLSSQFGTPRAIQVGMRLEF